MDENGKRAQEARFLCSEGRETALIIAENGQVVDLMEEEK